MSQNAQNQRFGHFFYPKRCPKITHFAPPLGCLAGCFFGKPKKATQQWDKMGHNGTDVQ
jgi:hypothetical protein